MKKWSALIMALVGLTLAAGSATAASSISLVWGHNLTATADASPSGSVAASSQITAHIVLSADAVGVAGVFISVLFDTSELQAVAALEKVAKVSMGNSFSPASPGFVIDNTAGEVTNLDWTVGLATGCISCTVTLGTVTFHVVSGVGGPGDIDAIAAVSNPGVDAIIAVGGADVSGTTIFNGASVVPEPTTAILVVGGLLGLGYAGRRSNR